ncbi:unnamed protein product [Pleuronectes platessa]|uniref:Uncharacterized protein n=1 Tax=Pleuronectes platessa TaxID=8262 RepID=A0A9N7U818_PLEPL|nr:unnamed protein product [Pleuronectes platessa]
MQMGRTGDQTADLSGGDLVEEETGLRYEPQHPPQLEAAGVSWEASRGGTLRGGGLVVETWTMGREVPLSKAPYSPKICSPCALHGCSLLCVSCTRWPGSGVRGGDLAEKQSLRPGNGSRLLGGGLVPGCTRAAHCEAGGAPADFTHLKAEHVSPAQGSPRLQGARSADSLSCNAWAAKQRRRRGERAAPYNFCGPYRFAPRTPICTNR